MLRPVNLLQCTQVWVMRSTHSYTEGQDTVNCGDMSMERNSQLRFLEMIQFWLSHETCTGAVLACFYVE